MINWKHATAGLGILLIIGLLIASTGSAEEAEFDKATVHLSPDCGCCTEHARYLERAGADIEIIEHTNEELNQLYDDLEVPQDLRSCHITETDDQMIKGHVPVDVFNQALEEEPEVDIVTLPGMPSGSPGMPGNQDEEWQFFKVVEGEFEGEFTTR